MGRIRTAVTRAQYAAVGAALGAAVGGLFSRSAASTGGATGALIGAVVGEIRTRAADTEGVTDRLTPGDDDPETGEGESPERGVRKHIEGRLPGRESPDS